MSKTLIVGEVQEGMLREATLELVAAAREIGSDVVSLLIGNGIGELGEELAKKGGFSPEWWRSPVEEDGNAAARARYAFVFCEEAVVACFEFCSAVRSPDEDVHGVVVEVSNGKGDVN